MLARYGLAYVLTLFVLAVSVFARRNSGMVIDAATSTFSFKKNLFYGKVRFLPQGLCESASIFGFLLPMFFQFVLDLVANDKWIL